MYRILILKDNSRSEYPIMLLQLQMGYSQNGAGSGIILIDVFASYRQKRPSWFRSSFFNEVHSEVCSNPPEQRNINRNNNSVAAVHLHNHPHLSPDQLYHQEQEILKTRQKWPTSKYSAFSTNNVRGEKHWRNPNQLIPVSCYLPKPT